MYVVCVVLLCYFFFFKQKTAYEMRISDWSSDVCSSDLTESGFRDAVFITSSYGLGEAVVQGSVNPDEFYVYKPNIRAKKPAILKRGLGEKAKKIGRASCRERVCQYV